MRSKPACFPITAATITADHWDVMRRWRRMPPGDWTPFRLNHLANIASSPDVWPAGVVSEAKRQLSIAWNTRGGQL